tara:strand:+ start:42 stop:1055 length:1014 start_codon:yes stop_codon:yes gene_type:complete
VILGGLDPAERERIEALSVLPEPSLLLTGLAEDPRRTLLPAATLSMNSGQGHEVHALFQEHLAAASTDPVQALVLARLCTGRDMSELALQALESCPSTRDSELIRADIARRCGYLHQAKAAYKRLAAGRDAVAEIARAEERLLKGDWEGAQEAALPLLAREPRLAYRGELIRGSALLRQEPGQAMLCFARAKRIVGNSDVRACLLQISAFVRLIVVGERAWLPEELMRSTLFLAPGGHAVLQLVTPLLEFLHEQPNPQLVGLVEQMLASVAQENYPLVHVALGSLRLVQQAPPERVFEHWKRALELDPAVELPAQDLQTLSNVSPGLARKLEGLRKP